MRSKNIAKLAIFAPMLVSASALADQPEKDSFTMGTRLWFSTGDTTWSHCADGSCGGSGLLGDPTSKLEYEGTDAVSAELTFKGEARYNVIAKGYVGIGSVLDGNLRDRDFVSGGQTFSDTDSEVDGESIRYGTVDIGYKFEFDDGHISPITGFNWYNERLEAYGAQCNQNDLGFACTSVSSGTRVIFNDASYYSWRLGVNTTWQATERLSLTADAAFLPVVYLDNEDSHYLRGNLGPTPNIFHDGYGVGGMLDVFVDYKLTDRWSAGAGFRYWRFEIEDGDATFGSTSSSTFPLREFASQRYGVMLQTEYRF